MALTLQQCCFVFRGIGLLTRRDIGKNAKGEATYAGDLATGTSRQYIKLTPEQYGQIPPDGMEPDVQGNIMTSKEGMYLQTTSVQRFGEVVSPSGGKARL